MAKLWLSLAQLHLYKQRALHERKGNIHLPHTQTHPPSFSKRDEEALKFALPLHARRVALARGHEPALWAEFCWVGEDGVVLEDGAGVHAYGCLVI
jgi:hypothetical protein